MSNVIDFLERMGQDAELAHARGGNLEAVLRTDATIDAESRTIILEGSHRDLEEMLGASSNLCCMVYPVEGTN